MDFVNKQASYSVCRKIGGVDAIIGWTAESRRNNLFRTKQTITNEPRNLFTLSEEKQNLPLLFWRGKDAMNVKFFVVSPYKEIKEVLLVYFQRKL